MRTASSSESKRKSGATGPKVSSWKMAISLVRARVRIRARVRVRLRVRVKG